MVYEVLALLLPLVTSPYVARTIGAEGLGQYSYSYSVAFYFVLFSMLGIKNYGNRAIAQSRENAEELSQTFSDILTVHILISLLCCAVYSVYILLLQTDQLYAVLQFPFVLSALFDISWFYFGIEKFKLTVIQSSAVKILTTVCVFAFVHTVEDIGTYCAILSIGTLVGQLVLWVPLKRYVHFVKPKYREMITHLKPLLILFIPAIAISLYKYMDKIMIGAISSKTELGLYENAEKIINIPLSVIGAFGTVMLPKMSALVTKNAREADRYILSSMRYVMCLAFALAFGIAGVGQTFAPLFWGASFSGAGSLIMGLAITIPSVSFANIIRTQYLIPRSRDMDYMVSVIAGAIINLVINGLLIPRWGAMGATIGTVAAETLVCVVQAFSVRHSLPLSLYIRNAIPFLLLGTGMFFLVFWMGHVLDLSWMTLGLQIMSGGILYTVASFAYLLLMRDSLVLHILGHHRRKQK